MHPESLLVAPVCPPVHPESKLLSSFEAFVSKKTLDGHWIPTV